MTASAGPVQNPVGAVLAFFYPEICQLCKTEYATAREGFVCSRCRSQVRFIKSPFCKRCGLPHSGDFTAPYECTNCREMEFHFSSARSAVVVCSVTREAVHRYKYLRAMWFEPFLADVLIREAKPVLNEERWDFIVPVPLHPLKQREREFNQAVRLASRLNIATRIPLNSNLLRRIKPTTTQTLLTRQQRTANMRGAFAIRPGAHLAGKRIVLVDDVFTTGATANACAQVLRTAGADDVCVWTVARGV
jgi:competence protein ComFC